MDKTPSPKPSPSPQLPPKPKPAAGGSQVICYTGVGARRSAAHTPAQFQRIVDKEKGRVCRDGGLLPCPSTLDGWVFDFGASRTSAAQCRRSVERNRAVGRAGRVEARAAALFRGCVDRACGSATAFAASNEPDAAAKPAKAAMAAAVCAAKRCAGPSAKLHAAELAWQKAALPGIRSDARRLKKAAAST
jgi:hypothetical protein